MQTLRKSEPQSISISMTLNQIRYNTLSHCHPFRYGNSFLQAPGLAQHGAAVVPVPDQAELRSPEGAGGPRQGFSPERHTSQSSVRTRPLYCR